MRLRFSISLFLILFCLSVEAQEKAGQHLRKDGNYACWLSFHLGAGALAPGYTLDNISTIKTIQLNMELFNGILTPSYRKIWQENSSFDGGSYTEARDYALLYGRYVPFRAGVFVYSAGPCYIDGFRRELNYDIFPDDFRLLDFSSGEFSTFGIETQAAVYFTFGVGYSIGFGLHSIYAPGLLHTGIGAALSLGAFKYKNKK